MNIVSDVPSCIIQETLAPPKSNLPEPALKLIQQAIEFHNSAKYQKALDCYVESRKLWGETVSEIPPDGEMYYLIMQGSVYLSMRKEQEALQKFMIAKQYSDLHFLDLQTHHIHAIVLGSIGCAYAYMQQFTDGLIYFKKALRIRLQTLGEKHVDTATVRNNVAVCMACSDPITASREEIMQHLTAAHSLMYDTLGPNHPRTATSLRNLSRESSRVVLKYSTTLPKLP